VCFGAQVIAAALGEEVRRGPSPEVGYRAVEPTVAGRSSPVRHVTGTPMAQWHGDTFDLPAATTLLASSEAYENQAFGIGDWLLAVQFHPELTDAMHEEWLVSDAAYLRRHGIDADLLRAERARHGAAQQVASARLLGEYLDGLEQLDGLDGFGGVARP
jgi:GMP synthase (glutamine-hydrolysing)